MANGDQGDGGGHEHSESETAVHDSPNADAAPGQSSASDWDMNRTKPSAEPGRNRTEVTRSQDKAPTSRQMPEPDLPRR